jgi:magnesium-transporting ATPase (P-type)
MVTSGRGEAVVVATGMRTEFGVIADPDPVDAA